MGLGPGPPRRLTVIALAAEDAVERLTHGDYDGQYLHEPPLAPTIVFGRSRDAEWQVAKHELAHHLAAWFLGVSPPWYEEGIASLLATIQYDRRNDRVYLGAPDAGWQDVMRREGPLSRKELFGQRPAGQAYARFEATSWALVHFLIATRNGAFERFQHRLGALEPNDEAWQAEFPDLDEDRLGVVLRQYRATGLPAIASRYVARWQGRIERRPLAPAEIHATWALLRAYVTPADGDPDLEAAGKEVRDALAADPALLDALALQFYVPGLAGDTSLGDIAARAVKARPDDWLSWLMAADAGDPAGGESALARALALGPHQPEVLSRMAALRASQNKWSAALALTEKAIALRGVNDELLTLHMAVLAFAGKCQAAASWNRALAAYLSGALGRRVALSARSLQWACAGAGRGGPRCQGAAARDGDVPTLDPSQQGPEAGRVLEAVRRGREPPQPGRGRRGPVGAGRSHPPPLPRQGTGDPPDHRQRAGSRRERVPA